MAGIAQRACRPACGLQRCGHSVLLDLEMHLRQTTGLTESLLKLVQLDWNVPDYSTFSRR
jgi:hypothetical protein